MNIRYFTLKLVCFGLISIAFCSCGKKKQTAEVLPVRVKVQSVETTSNVSNGEYVGTIVAELTSELSFPTTATVQTVYVKEGDRVKKGQLLARLDTQQAQSAYDATKASLLQAQDAFKRMDILYKNGSLPEIKYVEVQSKLEQAKSMESIARKTLNDCALYAPMSGVIGKRAVEPGMNVIPGAMVFTLLKTDNLNVQFSVPEKEVSGIKVGQKVNINIKALDNRQLNCVVTEKSGVASGVAHTYEIKARIQKIDKDIMPGMVCDVEMLGMPSSGTETASSNTVFVLPNNAVLLSFDNRRFVWLAVDGKATRRFVEIGELADNGVVITSGLSAGDKVITEGYHKISEGMAVEII